MATRGGKQHPATEGLALPPLEASLTNPISPPLADGVSFCLKQIPLKKSRRKPGPRRVDNGWMHSRISCLGIQ
jgi:hypothetical protein